MNEPRKNNIPLLAARLQMSRSAEKTVNDDLSAVDERFTGGFIESNYIERTVLERCMEILGEPPAEEMKPFTEALLREFTDKIYSEYLRHYGWSQSSLTNALARNLEPAELRDYATEIADKLAVELNRDNIKVDPDFDIEDGTVIAYLETLLDVDEKFGTHTADRDDEWLNLYAEYTPKTGELRMTYIVDNDNSSTDHEYVPTEKEKELIIGMMEEACQKYNGCSLVELVAQSEEITMGEMS